MRQLAFRWADLVPGHARRRRHRGRPVRRQRDDQRKVAGHAKERQTEKYDRDQLEAFRRTMKSRTGYRTRNDS